jgi:hypothetical protein
MGLGVVGCAICTGHAKQFERGETLVTPLMRVTIDRARV